MSFNQTDTKSYVCVQIALLYRRHFTGHSAATMTNEVKFTSCNQMDAYSDGWSGEKLLYTRHFISFPYFAMTSEVTFTTFNQMDTNSHTFSRENSAIYTSHYKPSIHPQFVSNSQRFGNDRKRSAGGNFSPLSFDAEQAMGQWVMSHMGHGSSNVTHSLLWCSVHITIELE